MTEIPGSAVKAEAADISEPIALLLRGLSLLPNETDLEKAGKATAAFTGPPDSVSVIEAGASAAAKWWSVTIAGGGLIAGGTILKVWKMKLTLERRKANSSPREARVMSRPATTTLPLVGESSAPIMFSSVVLPLPEGPRTTVNSDGSTVRLTPSSAVTVTSPIS